MNYNDALKLILQKQSLGIKPGLGRIEALLSAMGNPQNNLKIIHIAGTNGKGTAAAAIALALRNAGFKTGLFTSPWVCDYREQIQLDGRYIAREEFVEYIEKYGGSDATEFELLTAVMYKFFSDRGVDYAVVECGMGGLEDSTNAIPTPELAVITSVSVDHTGFLGTTVNEIAVHKAGIIKQGGRVVLYPNSACQRVFESRCAAENAVLYKVVEQGDFKKNNIETVRVVLHILGIDCDAVLPQLPARQEYINDGLMLDGAHNAGGAKALLTALPDGEISAVIGMMRDKDIEAYISLIAPRCKKIIATQPSNPRAASAEDIKKIALKYCNDVSAQPDPIKAVGMLNGDFNLVCGSFYLARDVRKELFI